MVGRHIACDRGLYGGGRGRSVRVVMRRGVGRGQGRAQIRLIEVHKWLLIFEETGTVGIILLVGEDPSDRVGAG